MVKMKIKMMECQVAKELLLVININIIAMSFMLLTL
jgi:hypothetical protein